MKIDVSFEQTTNAMAALTSFSMASALASVPTSLENFVLEVCKLRKVRDTQCVDLL